MRTSLINIYETERFLDGKLTAEESLQFRARLLLDPALRKNVSIQQRLYNLVRVFGRKKLKAEFEAMHHRIFSDPTHLSLRREIEEMFQRK